MRLLLLASLVFATSAAAQSAEQPATEPMLKTQGAFFALAVADLDASTRWYTEKLGLRVTMRVPTQERVALAVLEGGGLTVELIQHDDARPLPPSAGSSSDGPRVLGLFKAGVIIEDFDQTVTLLRRRGIEIVAGPFPSSPRQRANLLIRDHVGNLIQLFGK
jgi:catechol 2,3-dioxygenase-like lactoylglutathione lyase family enzyme